MRPNSSNMREKQQSSKQMDNLSTSALPPPISLQNVDSDVSKNPFQQNAAFDYMRYFQHS